MAFWTYLLRCADGSYCVGHTDDLDRRLAQHQTETFAGYTELRKPLRLAWSQEMPGREEALAAERQIKRWSRKKKEAWIRGDWEDLKQMARKDFTRR